MTRRIRVLFVIPTLDVGGAEMDLVHNAPRLDPARFEVSVCTMLRRGKLEAQLLDTGVTVVGPFAPVRRRTEPRPRRAWYAALRRPFPPVRRLAAAGLKLWRPALPVHLLRRIEHFFRGMLPAHWLMFFRLAHPLVHYIRAARIDVVHTILPNAYVVGGIACALTRRPLVMSRVSLNWYQKTQPIYHVLERTLMHRLVRIGIGNSTMIINELRDEGVPARRLRLVYNGIPIEAFDTLMGNRATTRATTRATLGLTPDTLIFTAVGTLWPYKGHADLLAALASANLPTPWVLLVIGRDIDGARCQLQRLGADLGLTGHVRFLGERGDVPALLAAADLHLTASHTEGVPNNVLEAMCAGLAVVATNVGGLPELVHDGHTGLLVPARKPDAMAAAIMALAGDPSRRAAMGQAARRRVEDHFSIEASVATLEAIYTGLAGRSRR